MALSPSYFDCETNPIQENILLFPEVAINSFDQPVDRTLQLTFDRLWNAAGEERSMYYDGGPDRSQRTTRRGGTKKSRGRVTKKTQGGT